jgi:signal transduction histidine kinase
VIEQLQRASRSLRVRLAVAGFVAIYVPVLVLLGVVLATEDTEVTSDAPGQVELEEERGTSPWTVGTAVALAPAAALLAWWLAGRAVRPIDQVRQVAEEIEATDLSRRIGLERGTTEVVALAGAFDGMLDRLEHAADAQRLLVEEASHELRTPLAVLQTNADVLLRHSTPTLDDYRAGIERSQTAAERLTATIEELLVDARGRARTIVRAPADLTDLVRDEVDVAAVLAGERGIEIEVRAPDEVTAPVDESSVRRALANLLANAVAHAPDGTSVEVEVREAAGAGEGAGEVIVVVIDHGPGVAPDDQARIFERFWQGRADGSGTGLGLPIAKQVAEAHGGSLTVESPGAAGDGATFTLRLRSA